MKTHQKQQNPVSRTIQSKPDATKQASPKQILQRHQDETTQRQELDEDDLLQGKFKEPIQRMESDDLDEEDLLQGKFETAQREEWDEDELLQGKFRDTAQRMEPDDLDEEDLLQGKFETTQLESSEASSSGDRGISQRVETDAGGEVDVEVDLKPNNTGLPDALKTGIENLSGYSMDDVNVHYNSNKPAQLQALAYTQGTDIHVAPGQEKHLPHEAWHVVQQKQGRVHPTMQLQGMNVNDNEGLEREADVMGRKSIFQNYEPNNISNAKQQDFNNQAIQLTPSEFLKFYQEEPLYHLTLLQQIIWMDWNSFVTYTKPYSFIDDNDIIQQRFWFCSWFAAIRSLSNNIDKYTDKQKFVVSRVLKMLEKEKGYLFGGTSVIEEDSPLSPDPITKNKNHIYMDITDSGYFFSNLWNSYPSIDDVKQGELGDCYLLAAVASIVHRKPEHFVTHMKDNLNGTVSVKLYEEEGVPKIIVIKKSVVEDRYAREVLWVKLLEKAYAAAGFKGNPDRSYRGVEGGDPGNALMHLTGKRIKGQAIGYKRSIIIEKVMNKLKGYIENLKEKIREKVNDNESESLKELLKLITEKIMNLDNMLQVKYVSMDQLNEFIVKLPENISNGEVNINMKEIIEEIVSEGDTDLLPGKLGSNKYGQDEKKLYEFIKQSVDAGQILTISTKNSIDDSENEKEKEKGHSAGEDLVKGLVSRHAYSVLNYKKQANGSIQIQLRNPWGYYSRVYESDGRGGLIRKAEPKGSGIFWMDIADIVASFTSISATDS